MLISFAFMVEGVLFVFIVMGFCGWGIYLETGAELAAPVIVFAFSVVPYLSLSLSIAVIA